MSTPAVKLEYLPVLLIEDEPAVMAYVRAALERSGYSVVCTESGAEGLRLLASQKFLGVVSDMRTPGGVDGEDVHAWLARNCPELAHRIVFITGDIANEDDLRRAIDQLETQMREAAKKFEFERAANLRDRVRALKQRDLAEIFAPPTEPAASA